MNSIRIRIGIALVVSLVLVRLFSEYFFVEHTLQPNRSTFAILPAQINSLVNATIQSVADTLKRLPDPTPALPDYGSEPLALVTGEPEVPIQQPSPIATVVLRPTLPPPKPPTATPYTYPTPTIKPTSQLRPTAPQPATPLSGNPDDDSSETPIIPTKAPGIQCPSSSSEQYGSVSVSGQKTANAASHPDLNLAIRGYTITTGTLGIIDVDGADDPKAPQLDSLFSRPRRPVFMQLYDVYDWDWGSNRRGGRISYSETQLAGLAFTPGEVIRTPASGYSIGSGYEVMVLYADATRVTLKYTREDNVVIGYALHIEDICVDPNLVSLYNRLNQQGRGSLPALTEGKRVGVARTNEVKVATRDTGQFLDPRIRKDWWRAY